MLSHSVFNRLRADCISFCHSVSINCKRISLCLCNGSLDVCIFAITDRICVLDGLIIIGLEISKRSIERVISRLYCVSIDLSVLSKLAIALQCSLRHGLIIFGLSRRNRFFILGLKIAQIRIGNFKQRFSLSKSSLASFHCFLGCEQRGLCFFQSLLCCITSNDSVITGGDSGRQSLRRLFNVVAKHCQLVNDRIRRLGIFGLGRCVLCYRATGDWPSASRAINPCSPCSSACILLFGKRINMRRSLAHRCVVRLGDERRCVAV